MQTPNQALLNAVARGNLSKATESLRLGANPNVADEMGQLPVLIAMRQKDRAMLALLMKGNANLRAITQDNLYPMALAAIMGDNEAIRVMASHCADFESPIESEPSALEHAFISGRLNTAQELIRHGADVECIGSNGEPMIARMAAMGNEDAVRLLIEEGVLIHGTDLNGAGILDYALNSGKKGMARLIRAQMRLQNSHTARIPSRTALRAASQNSLTQKLLSMLQRARLRLNRFERDKANATAHFIKFMEDGDLTSASDLLRTREINVHSNSRGGAPLLVLAARACQQHTTTDDMQNASRTSMVQSLIERLVEKGANPLALDRSTGRNLLHELIEQKQEAMSIHFLAIGILTSGINRSDRQLDRPLHLVSRTHMPHLAMSLIQKGADINPVNRLGQTPLHICAMHVDISIAETLIGKGANRNLKTRNGQTVHALLRALDNDSRSFAIMLEARKSIESAMSIFTANNPMASLARSGISLTKPPSRPERT